MTMGWVIGVLAVLAAAAGFSRFAGPDIARYMRMRKM